ncbi:unnamed protein product [Symbiodinium sp. CCMP2592]|nr:unnamed protein product [Symbiodinium sp. CCMP2592]
MTRTLKKNVFSCLCQIAKAGTTKDVEWKGRYGGQNRNAISQMAILPTSNEPMIPAALFKKLSKDILDRLHKERRSPNYKDELHSGRSEKENDQPISLSEEYLNSMLVRACMATLHAKRITTTVADLRFVIQLDQMSTGQGISDPSRHQASPQKSQDPMSQMLDSCLDNMKESMAKSILGKNAKKKDKKKKKKASSDSDSKEASEEELPEHEVERQLGIILGLKGRALKLKSVQKYEDMLCDLGLHLSSAEQVCYILAESHKDIGCLTVLDLCELGGEHKTLALKHEAACKLPARKRKQADAQDRESFERAQKLVSWSDSRWKDRLMQLFELLVGKSRKTTVVGFDTIAQLRQSILPRIKDRVKSGEAEFKTQLLDLLANLKNDARTDLGKMEQKILDSLENTKDIAKKPRKEKDEGKAGNSAVFDKYRKSKTKPIPDEDSTDCEKSEANDSEATQVMKGKPAANEAESSGEEGSAPQRGAVRDCRRRLFEGDDDDLFAGGKFGEAALEDGKPGQPEPKPGDGEQNKAKIGNDEEKKVEPAPGAQARGSPPIVKSAMVPYVDSEAGFKSNAAPVLNTAPERAEAPVNLELMEMLSEVVSAHLPREQDAAAFFDLLSALGCTDPVSLLSKLDNFVAKNHANFFIATSASRQKFQRLSFSQKLAVTNSIKTVIDSKDN